MVTQSSTTQAAGSESSEVRPISTARANRAREDRRRIGQASSSICSSLPHLAKSLLVVLKGIKFDYNLVFNKLYLRLTPVFVLHPFPQELGGVGFVNWVELSQ